MLGTLLVVSLQVSYAKLGKVKKINPMDTNEIRVHFREFTTGLLQYILTVALTQVICSKQFAHFIINPYVLSMDAFVFTEFGSRRRSLGSHVF